MARSSSLAEVEAFADAVDGPLGVALREVGRILDIRLRERRQTWSDLDKGEIVALFVSAFMEAAPAAYPDADPDTLAAFARRMTVEMAIELAANADGGEALH